MSQTCPNTNHPDWIAISNKYGEDVARAFYIKNNNQMPSLQEVDTYLLPKKGTSSQDLTLDYVRTTQNVSQNIENKVNEELQRIGVSGSAMAAHKKANRIVKNTVDGTFNPTQSRDFAKNLEELIRIAQGNRSVQHVSNDMVAFVKEAVKAKNSKFHDRLLEVFKDIDNLELFYNTRESGSFEHYSAIHRGNTVVLAEKAIDFLIEDHILSNKSVPGYQWGALMNRYKKVFNDLFRNGDIVSLQQEVASADKELGTLITDLLGGKVKMYVTLGTQRSKTILETAKHDLTTAKGIFTAALELEHKRIGLVRDTQKYDPTQTVAMQERTAVLYKLEDMMNQGNYDAGILAFMEQILTDMDTIFKGIDVLKLQGNTPTAEVNQIASFIRELKTYIDAYTPLLQNILTFTRSQDYQDNSQVDLTAALGSLTQVLQLAENQYKELSVPLFTQFIKEFAGKMMGRKVKGELIDDTYIENLVLEASKDIGLMDRFLFSMAESNDLMLRLFERPVKHAKTEARRKSLDTMSKLQMAQEALEAAGHKSTAFVYEVDENGKLTGNFMQEIYWPKFLKAREAEVLRLNQLYGPRDGKNSRSWWADFNKWENKHMTKDLGTQAKSPKVSLYANPAFTKMTAAQKAYYDTLMEVKQDMDKLLPRHRINPYLTPQIRKDYLEVMKSAESIGDFWQQWKTRYGDTWTARESDDIFGARLGKQNFDGTKLDVLPVYYTAKLDKLEHLSTDATSSMIMYADMAHHFHELNNIVDIMEVGRDLMRNREVGETIGPNNKPVVESFKSLGRKVNRKITKRQGSHNIGARVDDFMSQQLYGITSKDQGSINIPFTDIQLSVAKIGSKINKNTALTTYALNGLSGMANLNIGKAMMRIEAASKEFVDYKNLVKADMLYGKHLPSMLAEIGQRRKKDKLNLMIERFHVMRDHDKRVRETEMMRKNIFSRLIKQSSLFFLNHAGEHYMQARIFLALADRYKLKDSSGRIINLWDAFEVRKDQYGAEKAMPKKGITKLDGSEFTLADEELIANRSSRINNKLQGIYNSEDANAFQMTMQGKLVMMFKKWMVPYYNRRYQRENYSFDLDAIEEGYYITAYSFAKSLVADLISHQFHMATRWGSLTDMQKGNVIKAITEISYLLLVTIAHAVLKGAWKDDDEWIKSFTTYQLRRLRAEIGVLTPNIRMGKEALNLLKSPAAGINYVQNLMNLLYLTDLLEDPLQSGKYKGWNKYARNVVKVVPVSNTVRKFFAPEEAEKFYELAR